MMSSDFWKGPKYGLSWFMSFHSVSTKIFISIQKTFKSISSNRNVWAIFDHSSQYRSNDTKNSRYRKFFFVMFIKLRWYEIFDIPKIFLRVVYRYIVSSFHFFSFLSVHFDAPFRFLSFFPFVKHIRI